MNRKQQREMEDRMTKVSEHLKDKWEEKLKENESRKRLKQAEEETIQ